MSDWTYPDDSEIPTRDGEHGDEHFDGKRTWVYIDGHGWIPQPPIDHLT